MPAVHREVLSAAVADKSTFRLLILNFQQILVVDFGLSGEVALQWCYILMLFAAWCIEEAMSISSTSLRC